MDCWGAGRLATESGMKFGVELGELGAIGGQVDERLAVGESAR